MSIVCLGNESFTPIESHLEFLFFKTKCRRENLRNFRCETAGHCPTDNIISINISFQRACQPSCRVSQLKPH